jgi:Cu-Zn family superoxide dismutase
MKAIAVLQPLGESKVSGKVIFTQKEGALEITGEITGLTPGEHGFHVHEFGDCSAPDGASVGGHFNPTGMPHACPMADKHHAGDMGNIKADDEGKVVLQIEDKDLQLSGPTSIIGRSIIVHANRDDCSSQPAGNSGPKIACGVIGIAKP